MAPREEREAPGGGSQPAGASQSLQPEGKGEEAYAVRSVSAAHRDDGCAAGSSPPHRRNDCPPAKRTPVPQVCGHLCLGRGRLHERLRAPGPHHLKGGQVRKRGCGGATEDGGGAGTALASERAAWGRQCMQ